MGNRQHFYMSKQILDYTKKKLQIFFSKIFIFGHGIGTFRFFLTPLQKNVKKLFSTFLRCFNGFGWEKNKKKFWKKKFLKIFIFGRGIGTFRFFLTPLQKMLKIIFNFPKMFQWFWVGKKV